MPWYAEKIFSILKHPRSLKPKTVQGFRWLTGDLSFYDTKDYEEDMVWLVIQSGNMDVIDWLTRQGFIKIPATPLKTDLMTGSNHATTKQKAVAYSRNTVVLEWAYNNALINNWQEVFVEVVAAVWMEGFVWMQDKFPYLLLKEWDYASYHDLLEMKCRAFHVAATREQAIPLL